MRAGLAAQVGEMARRSIIQTLRQPAQIVPPLTFPLMLLAVNVGGLDAANLRVADLRLHEPSLDDVFLAKTGRSLEGAGAPEPSEEPAPA